MAHERNTIANKQKSPAETFFTDNEERDVTYFNTHKAKRR